MDDQTTNRSRCSRETNTPSSVASLSSIDTSQAAPRDTLAFSRRGVLATLAVQSASAMACHIASSEASFASDQQTSLPRDENIAAVSEEAQRAIEDYSKNMRGWGGRLSNDASMLIGKGSDAEFDVVIIGSGYGASVCAARLSSKLKRGKKLCILERGREWIPGTFPRSFEARRHQLSVQSLGANSSDPSQSSPLALYQLANGQGIRSLSGSALGGTSLIGAGVAMRPDREVFSNRAWPTQIRQASMLDPYFEQVEWEWKLGIQVGDFRAQSESHRMAVEQLRDQGAHFEAAALAIAASRSSSRFPILNRQGLQHRKCVGCGECFSGCNVGAKLTLTSNYLPMAKRAGAEIYSQVEVHSIEKVVDRYRIHYSVHERSADGQTKSIAGSMTAKLVILGAGSLGTTELLMRSQSQNLRFSQRLGARISTQGELLYALSDTSAERNDRASIKRGPTVAAVTQFPNRRNLQGRNTIAPIHLDPWAASVFHWMADGQPLASPKFAEFLMGLGHDQAGWKLEACDEKSTKQNYRLNGEPAASSIVAHDLQHHATAMGRNGRLLSKRDALTACHMTGGCAMGDDPGTGVVNHRGQVFDTIFGGDRDRATKEYRVHHGLYVVDGASIPTSLACGPSLTISAIAERTAQLITLDTAHADLFDL